MSLLALALLALPSAGTDREEEARTLLEKTEAMVAAGHHAAAVTAYRRLAASHGDTEAGKTAARRSLPNALLGWSDLVRTGPSSNRVDVVVLGDGYTLKHLDPFDDVAKTVPVVLERNEVFGEYFGYFNFLRANVVSADDGVDGFGREYDTALGGRMSGGLQGQVTVDRGLVREMLREIPEQEGLAVVFVRTGTLGTGGGGIAVLGGRDDDTLVHEWGHAFAGLADEYATDTGHRGPATNRINVSDSEDPRRVPWRHWLEARVRGIGIYQGADGRVRGAWKPTASGCVMESGGAFCPVCREALVLAIHARVDPIEAATPDPHPGEDAASAILVTAAFTLPASRPRFEVTTIRPRTHSLEVSWWVLPEFDAPETPRSDPAPRGADRRARGPLPPIAAKPVASRRTSGTDRFDLDPEGIGPGLYRVICRVRDGARPRGERGPWVLKDERGLLESERAWWVQVEPEGGSATGR